jgi:hypothetical protein
MKNSEPKQFIDVKFEEVDDIPDSSFDTPKRKRKKSRKRIIITLLISLLSVCLVCGLAAGSCYFIYQKEVSNISILEKQAITARNITSNVKSSLNSMGTDLERAENNLSTALVASVANDNLEFYAKAYNTYYSRYSSYKNRHSHFNDVYKNYQQILSQYNDSINKSVFNKNHSPVVKDDFKPPKTYDVIIPPNQIIQMAKSTNSDSSEITKFKYNLYKAYPLFIL